MQGKCIHEGMKMFYFSIDLYAQSGVCSDMYMYSGYSKINKANDSLLVSAVTLTDNTLLTKKIEITYMYTFSTS